MNATETRRYAVNEIFPSVQGEGAMTGTPAVFVRLSGCNRQCPFCDTDHSAATPMTAREIHAAVAREGIHSVVFTGGEPALQLDPELLAPFLRDGFRLMVETNGTLPLPDGPLYVVCSPKCDDLRIARIDELKVVYQGEGLNPDPEHYVRLCRSLGLDPKTLSLQPCSMANVAETVQYVLHHPHWRLSLQSHKLINIP